VKRLTPCSPSDYDAVEMRLADVDPDELLAPPVGLYDLLQVLGEQHPSCSEAEVERLQQWGREKY
jgi:vacuolar protein-sorting-associated protein 4